jgi:hypothetical protein
MNTTNIVWIEQLYRSSCWLQGSYGPTCCVQNVYNKYFRILHLYFRAYINPISAHNKQNNSTARLIDEGIQQITGITLTMGSGSYFFNLFSPRSLKVEILH